MKKILTFLIGVSVLLNAAACSPSMGTSSKASRSEMSSADSVPPVSAAASSSPATSSSASSEDSSSPSKASSPETPGKTERRVSTGVNQGVLDTKLPEEIPSKAPAKSPAANSKAAETSSAAKYQLVLPTQGQLAGMSRQLIALVNAERVRHGVSSLRTEEKLTRAAQIRAAECSRNFPANNGYTRPDGSYCATVLNEVQYGTRTEQQESKDGVHWYQEVSYDYGTGAENLANAGYDPAFFPQGFRSTAAEISRAAQRCFDEWKANSTQYRAMVNSAYTATGVGCYAIKVGNTMSIQAIQEFTEK